MGGSTLLAFCACSKMTRSPLINPNRNEHPIRGAYDAVFKERSSRGEQIIYLHTRISLPLQQSITSTYQLINRNEPRSNDSTGILQCKKSHQLPPLIFLKTEMFLTGSKDRDISPSLTGRTCLLQARTLCAAHFLRTRGFRFGASHS